MGAKNQYAGRMEAALKKWGNPTVSESVAPVYGDDVRAYEMAEIRRLIQNGIEMFDKDFSGILPEYIKRLL